MSDIEQMDSIEINDYYGSDKSTPYVTLPTFENQREIIYSLFNKNVGKSILDIGEGKAFWANSFIEKIDHYTAIEKNNNNCLLIQENFHLYNNKINVINADVFKFDYQHILVDTVDTIVLSFFICHFELSTIIKLLKKIFINNHINKILILDSSWSKYRKNKFIQNKLEYHRRIIDSKNNIIDIPKRFVSKEDIESLSTQMSMKFDIKYWDDYWLFAILYKH